MAHFVEALQGGQTVFWFAHAIFGEEYDRLVTARGRADIVVAVVVVVSVKSGQILGRRVITRREE